MKTLRPSVERLLDRSGGCWLWLGRCDRDGYGRVHEDLLHRYVYKVLVGPIPSGTELDHLCRVRRCCNPKHLEPVTHQVNVVRGEGSKTHCRNGHEFTAANTWLGPGREGRLWRKCRCCCADAQRRHTERKKAAA